MKKVFIASAVLFMLASCAREETYTCSCTYTAENGEPKTEENEVLANDDTIDDICSSENISYDSTAYCQYY